jgi:hypothetical protein
MNELIHKEKCLSFFEGLFTGAGICLAIVATIVLFTGCHSSQPVTTHPVTYGDK